MLYAFQAPWIKMVSLFSSGSKVPHFLTAVLRKLSSFLPLLHIFQMIERAPKSSNRPRSIFLWVFGENIFEENMKLPIVSVWVADGLRNSCFLFWIFLEQLLSRNRYLFMPFKNHSAVWKKLLKYPQQKPRYAAPFWALSSAVLKKAWFCINLTKTKYPNFSSSRDIAQSMQTGVHERSRLMEIWSISYTILQRICKLSQFGIWVRKRALHGTWKWTILHLFRLFFSSW